MTSLLKRFLSAFAPRVPTVESPIAVERLWMLPDGLYRMRNGDTAVVAQAPEAPGVLVRCFGGTMPSVIPLTWDERGAYTKANPFHPFDLVEFMGAERQPAPRRRSF